MAPPEHLSDRELLETATAGREELDTVDRERHDRVWAAIAGEAFDDQEDAPPHDADAASTPPGADDDAVQMPDDHDGVATAGPGDADVISLADRRRTSSTLGWVVSAVAAVVIAVAGAWTALTPTTETVATYAMDALDERATTAVNGAIVRRADATVVEVDLSGLPERGSDSFYELWFLDLDSEQIISLGRVEPSTTSVTVPENLDPAQFPLLDVSVEPDDGVQAHSGDSVLRGPITASG